MPDTTTEEQLAWAQQCERWMDDMTDTQKFYFVMTIRRLAEDPNFGIRFSRDLGLFREMFFGEKFDELMSWFESSYH